MNKYVIPICNIPDSNVFNIVILARSTIQCQEKIMEKYSDIVECDSWHEFVNAMDKKDILIGEITDIEEL